MQQKRIRILSKMCWTRLKIINILNHFHSHWPHTNTLRRSKSIKDCHFHCTWRHTFSRPHTDAQNMLYIHTCGIMCMQYNSALKSRLHIQSQKTQFSANVQNVKRTHCRIYTNAAGRQTAEAECEQTSRALVIGLRL